MEHLDILSDAMSHIITQSFFSNIARNILSLDLKTSTTGDSPKNLDSNCKSSTTVFFTLWINLVSERCDNDILL